jgi:hypothetical protein
MKITLLYTTERQRLPALVLWKLDEHWYLVTGKVPAAIKQNAQPYRLHNGSKAYCITYETVQELEQSAVRIDYRGKDS